MAYLVNCKTGLLRMWTPLWEGSANFRAVSEAEAIYLNPQKSLEQVRVAASPELVEGVDDVAWSPPEVVNEELPVDAPVEVPDLAVSDEDTELLNSL